jgi:hypothetical protein
MTYFIPPTISYIANVISIFGSLYSLYLKDANLYTFIKWHQKNMEIEASQF